MAFRLSATESVREGVKRIAGAELVSAAANLETGKSGEGIHEARKSLKKTRALVRLLRFELGPSYQQENTRLGDLGRTLSQYRDADAMVETLDQLVERQSDRPVIHTLDAIRQSLLTMKMDLSHSFETGGVAATVAEALRREARKADTWPLEKDGFQALAPGLEHTYRQGRKALKKARKEPSADTMHQLRKRVKDHLYQMRLLEKLWNSKLRGRGKDLKRLETWLGDHHNLAVLEERMAQKDPYLPTLIGASQRELESDAVQLSERLYEDRPAKFLRRVERCWGKWRK